MKKSVLLLVFCFTSLSVSAASTKASQFAGKQYGEKNGCSNVCIKVLNEYTTEYEQKIGEPTILAITYGYGDMKIKGGKKIRISYIVLLDEECRAFESYIIPSK